MIVFLIFTVLKHTHGNSSVTGLSKEKYVALLRLDGMIAPGRDFSGNELIATLKEAFADTNAEGVILDINSPGGTPVQASIIHDAILKYKQKYHKKVIVVGEDMLTSGAYFVAVAGDKIYVNPNTITGSIGVIVKGFGFVEILKKLGIERRVYTSGANKDRLDPFLPQTAEDTKKIADVTAEIHRNFANVVLAGRKGKLKASPEQLFTGDFWTGTTALNLGLVDALGNLADASEAEFHTTEFKEYSTASGLMRLLGGQLSTSLDRLWYGF